MASTLIKILERCGVRKRDIAHEFGVSRATASRWGSGARHMTPAQHERLLAWAYRAQMAAIDAAAARDAATPLALTQVGAGIETARLKYDLDQLWHDYRWEIQPLTFHAGVLAILQRWGAYSQDLNPANFHPKPDDIDRLWEDTRRLRAWIATWRRLHETPPAEEDPDHGA